jgi:protoporphyrin/coproporphyrin ferrochelatase
VYDAILVVSFGGPEGMADVIPFLENVLKGRNVPRERLLAVAKHYELFDGVSPINQQNRQLITALKQLLDREGPPLPIYFGNRNWHPLLPGTLERMRDDGIRRALAFVTSAYSSYSSCRQYLENIADACAAVGPDAPQVEKLRAFYDHPGFIEANVENIRRELDDISADKRSSVHLVFTAHSIPESMARSCDYQAQLSEAGRLIANQLGFSKWQLVFQSRSGSPMQPWLGPDVCDYLKQLNDQNAKDVIVAPIGFVSDHMEVIYDLDVEAKQLCERMGLNMRRAATAGTHPAFVKMIRDLILERLDPTRPKQQTGGATLRQCGEGCCLPASYSQPQQ